MAPSYWLTPARARLQGSRAFGNHVHTGEVQGSIPCAPARSIAKSITYKTVSRRLCPKNYGAQPGHRTR
jgi:hypothetical protein